MAVRVAAPWVAGAPAGPAHAPEARQEPGAGEAARAARASPGPGAARADGAAAQRAGKTAGGAAAGQAPALLTPPLGEEARPESPRSRKRRLCAAGSGKAGAAKTPQLAAPNSALAPAAKKQRVGEAAPAVAAAGGAASSPGGRLGELLLEARAHVWCRAPVYGAGPAARLAADALLCGAAWLDAMRYADETFRHGMRGLVPFVFARLALDLAMKAHELQAGRYPSFKELAEEVYERYLDARRRRRRRAAGLAAQQQQQQQQQQPQPSDDPEGERGVPHKFSDFLARLEWRLFELGGSAVPMWPANVWRGLESTERRELVGLVAARCPRRTAEGRGGMLWYDVQLQDAPQAAWRDAERLLAAVDRTSFGMCDAARPGSPTRELVQALASGAPGARKRLERAASR